MSVEAGRNSDRFPRRAMFSKRALLRLGAAAAALTAVTSAHALEFQSSSDPLAGGLSVAAGSSDVGQFSLEPGIFASPYAQTEAEYLGNLVWNFSGGVSTQAVKPPPGVVVPPPPTLVFPIRPIAPSPATRYGENRIIAIIDDGVDIDHPEFTGRILIRPVLENRCFSANCAGNPQADGSAINNHGTHVAGIAAGEADGVAITGLAHNSLILPVKVLDNGSGSFADLATGINFAATKGVHVINMSLGGDTGSVVAGVDAAIANAAGVGIVTVVAAGNSGLATIAGFSPANSSISPGIIGTMLTVGSVDFDGTLSSFSNRPGAAYRNWHVVARGGGVNSSVPVGTGPGGSNYDVFSGTSMASPYVAGLAAAIGGAHPFLTNFQIVDIIRYSAIDLGAKGVDNSFGWGLANDRALLPVGATPVGVACTTIIDGAANCLGGASPNPVSGLPSGGAAAAGGTIQQARVGGALAQAFGRSSALGQVVAFDAFGRDFTFDLAGTVKTERRSMADRIWGGATMFEAMGIRGEGFEAVALADTGERNSVAEVNAVEDQRDLLLSNYVTRAKFGEDSEVLFGINASAAGQLNRADLAASEGGLFLDAQALNSPYLGFGSAMNFAAAGFAMAPDLTVTMGYSWSAEQDGPGIGREVTSYSDVRGLGPSQKVGTDAHAATANILWAPAEWALVALTATFTEEADGFLGGRTEGAFALSDQVQTASAGVTARLGLGDGWSVHGSWSMGLSSLEPQAASIVRSADTVTSQAYGLAVSKLGVFGDQDQLGFTVSRPLHITDGALDLAVVSAVDRNRAATFASERLNLASATPETQFELGYRTRLDERMSLSAHAFYHADQGGVAGVDGGGGFLRLSIATGVE